MKYLSIIILLLLSGCQALTGIDSSYPNYYGKLPTLGTTECPNISGTFTNEGNASHSYSPLDGLLSYYLAGPKPKPSKVNIISKPDQISISFDGKYVKDLKIGNDYTCQEGAIWLKPIISGGAEGLGGYRAEKVLGLRKALNGNLIGEDRLSSVGALLWVVPIIGSQTFWYRWWPDQ